MSKFQLIAALGAAWIAGCTGASERFAAPPGDAPADGGHVVGYFGHEDGRESPPPPSCESLPSLTSLSEVTVRGEAEAFAAVTVTGGASDHATVAGADGRFELAVRLRANVTNMLRVRQTVGGRASDPCVLETEHDGAAPAAPVATCLSLGLEIGQCPLRVALAVHGAAAVEAYATVRVENLATGASTEATADASGSFALRIDACAGDRLLLVAVDAAGNVSAATRLSAH